MAVKQNNAETQNETTPAAASTANVVAQPTNKNSTAANIVNIAVNITGVGPPKMKPSISKPNAIIGGVVNNSSGILDDDEPVANDSPKQNIFCNNFLSSLNFGLVGSSDVDIQDILQRIEFIERKQLEDNVSIDMFKVYHHLIIKLANCKIPRKVPEDLKRFKQDIQKVGQFFSKAPPKRYFLFFLTVVCKLLTNDNDVPSCAVAVIFQLFSTSMVFEAVQNLLDHKIAEQSIRRTVRLLSDWLRMCNFCQNLNMWILAIMTGLYEQQKFVLFDELAHENVENLFASLILPVIRPKVAPIVFLMLSSVTDSPHVFHKIIPRFSRVMNCLKQQFVSVDENIEETKRLLQQLVDLTHGLMARFPGYDELYEQVETVLKDFRPFFERCDDYNDDDSIFHNTTNAKVGLVNLGNTCYMNSVLQALAMTKEFSREILLSKSKAPLVVKMQQQIALMLYSLRCELTPTRVLNATRPPSFAAGLQQDSSEFLGYLLETLHDQEIGINNVNVTSNTNVDDDGDVENEIVPILLENNDNDNDKVEENNVVEMKPNAENKTDADSNRDKSNISSLQSKTLDENKEKLSTTTEDTKDVIKKIEISTIEKTFTGKLATTYKCLTCGFESRNADIFRDLQLAFPETQNDCASNYSVQDLLEYYCSREKLDGDNQYYCVRCQKLSDGERFINVISPPKNLIITLKHFKYDQKYHMRAKLMHKVFHDEKVSIKVYPFESSSQITHVHYDLYAGVVHSGYSMDSGHYYTLASDANNRWYKFNDNIVTFSQIEELHNLTPPNTPYILFYQMSSKTIETIETTSVGQTVKINVSLPLTIDELPSELKTYVHMDNCNYNTELKLRRYRYASQAALQNALKLKQELIGSSTILNGSANLNGSSSNGRTEYDDDDENQPPPSSGCGGNAMDKNINRFVF